MFVHKRSDRWVQMGGCDFLFLSSPHTHHTTTYKKVLLAALSMCVGLLSLQSNLLGEQSGGRSEFVG